MSNRLSKQHFWEWFKRHSEEYLQLYKKNKKEYSYWKNEMNAHLRAHGRYMNFALEYDEKTNNGILTITSLGNPRFFKKIEAFVAKAPEIPDWKIQALVPPQAIDFLIEERFGHTGIDVNDFRFIQGEEQEYVFIIYHPLYVEDKQENFIRVAKAVLYNILGERSYGADIADYIDVENTSYAPDATELLRLTELPALLGNKHSSWIVDDEGNIKESK